MMLVDYFCNQFPNLRNTFFEITSPVNPRYNCIAWAASDDYHWWWPSQYCFWPIQAPMENTIDAFIIAYSTIGYAECDNEELEFGFEKIALYAKGNKPQHAARQLNDGFWTSKLGKSCDIIHTLEGLEGDEYGKVVKFLKRALP